MHVLDQGCTARGPDPAPEHVVSSPRNRLQKYKKLLLNNKDFMNELKFYRTANNFATNYNPKQLRWQQYKTTSNKKGS